MPGTESTTVLESGFHAVDSGFHVVDSSLCPWNLDSEFRSLVGYRIHLAVFRTPKPRILDSKAKMCQILDSTSKHFTGFRNPDFLT